MRAALAPAALLGAAPAAAAEIERLTLSEAVTRALQRNPGVLVAQEEVRRAEALLRQARAASLPTIAGNLTYTRLDNDRVLGDRVILSANQLSANSQVNVPLLAPQRWMQWRHATDDQRIAEASACEALRLTAAATARAYLTLLGLRRNLEAMERARDTARAHLEFARARLRGGIGTRLDEVRAAQELAADEAQVQTAQAARTRAQKALGVLVGAEGPVDAADEGPPAPVPPLAEALAEVPARRTDLHAQQLRTRAAERVLQDSWADYMPFLQGVFQPFFQRPATFAQPEVGWQAQLILSVPLYDGGVRYGLCRERAAVTAEARAQLEGALRQARSEVWATFEGVRRANEALRSAREAAQLALEALRLANLAYGAGATTNIEVVDAVRRARDAETAAAAAEDAAHQACLDLLIASGRFP